jgi:hypothetical protein
MEQLGLWDISGDMYVCGMSVPQVMIKRVVTRLIESKIFEVKETKNG